MKKNLIIFSIFLFFLLMTVGYAAINLKLNIIGKASFDGTFKVEFTSAIIENKSQLETITINDLGDTITFNLKIANYNESDLITYTIKNNGSIDAVLDDIVFTSNDTDVIYECSSIQGDLLSGQQRTGTIKATWSGDMYAPAKDVSFNATIQARQKVS